MTTLRDIEQFIIAAGSDDLGTFGGGYQGGVEVQQVPDEIGPCILALLESGKTFESYLELGVAAGGLTYLVNHYLKPEKIVLVDDNQHHKAGKRVEVLRGIAYREIIGKSLDETVIEETRSAGPYDLMMIDGDHNYPGVKLDVTTYLPMLASGGYLMLHDSAMPQWGVMRTVKELKADCTMEFIGEFVSMNHTPLGVALFKKVAA